VIEEFIEAASPAARPVRGVPVPRPAREQIAALMGRDRHYASGGDPLVRPLEPASLGTVTAAADASPAHGGTSVA